MHACDRERQGAHHTLRGYPGAGVEGGGRTGLGVGLGIVDGARQPIEGALQINGLPCTSAADQACASPPKHVLTPSKAACMHPSTLFFPFFWQSSLSLCMFVHDAQ